MVLKYVIGIAPLVLEDLIVKIYEAQNDQPGAEVYTEVLPEDVGGGHPNEVIVIADGLDKLVHNVYLYGVTSGTRYERYTAEPKEAIVTIFSPIRFKIGDGQPLTPANNTNEYQNDLLIGKNTNEFVFFKKDIGPLYPILDYTFFPLTGIIQLTGAQIFWEENPGEGEEYLIMLQPEVIETVVNDSVVGKDFGGFFDIVANTVYNNANHLRKLLRFKAAVNYTFQVGDNIPIGYPFRFQNFSAVTGRVEFLNFPLTWPGGDKVFIDFPSKSEGSFVFDGAKWNVVWLSQSSFVDTGTVNPGQTIAIGSIYLGNTVVGDVLYTVTHNKGIAGDYAVFFSIQGTISTASKDNDTQVAWYHHATDKPNKFNVVIGEPTGSIGHDVTLYYLLIKL